MSDVEQADVVVIGLGPGGEDLAGRLAEAGLEVVGIEQQLVGGECPYWGCIPSKMIVRAADLLAEARRIPSIAGAATVSPDWAPVARRIREEATTNWDDQIAVERLERKGGRLIRGAGRIVEPGRVVVGDRVVEARRGIVVASGTTAAAPPVPGLDQVPYWTNREAIATEQLPPSLVVLGGGAVGVELAQAFARFGVSVTIIEAMERLASAEEPEAGRLLAEVLTGEGIVVHTGAKVTEVRGTGEGAGGDEGGDGGVAVELADGTTAVAAKLLVATGRRANLAAVGMSAVGVDESQRWVPVDDHLRVTDGVWAVGDITGQGAFTHVAVYQAAIAAADILGEDPPPADYHALPRVTFSDPEIGSVGLTEAQAQEAGLNVRTGTVQVPRVARGWIHRAGNDGFIKLVEDVDEGELVGATAMGPNGGEVLGLLTLAVHARVPTAQLRHMIYAYPTFHRGVEDALRDLG